MRRVGPPEVAPKAVVERRSGGAFLVFKNVLKTGSKNG